MRTNPLHHRPASRGVYPPGPPGFTFLEVILAAAMLAVLFSVAGQLIVNMKRQTRLIEQQSLGLHTVENAMEELTALPWDEIDDAAITALPLPAEVRQRWPSAALTGSVTPLSDPVESKRIALSLSLSPESRTRPASLTTWIYRRPRD